MDRLSIASGVAGLVSLAIQLTQTTSTYVSSVRGASESAAALHREFTSLQSTLIHLKTFLDNQPALGPFRDTSALGETIKFCKIRLEELLAKLQPLKNSGKVERLLRTLTYPLSEAQNKESIRDIQRCTQTFNLSLTVEGCALLSKTSNDVSEILTAQVEALEEVQKVTGIANSAVDLMISTCHQATELLQMAKSNTTTLITIAQGVGELKELLGEISMSDVRGWLAAPDPSTNQHAAQKKRIPDTGRWVFLDPNFQAWKESTNSLLWLYGIPGSGKTIICSTIVSWLQEINDSALQESSLAYYYFDFSDSKKQTVDGLVRSIITQLSSRSLPPSVKSLHQKYSKNLKWGNSTASEEELITTLEALLGEVNQPVFLIIDALDECREVADIMSLLVRMHSWKSQGVHILVLSRREIEITDHIMPLEPIELSLENQLVDNDILLYIESRLSTTHRLKRWAKAPDIKHRIRETLSAGANGMFRWVACQLDQLETCLTLEAVELSLASLPEGLDETYERILLQLNRQYLPLTIKALQWLAVSQRPLSIMEVAEATSISPESSMAQESLNRGKRQLSDPRDILLLCSSLVRISKRYTKHRDEYQWSEEFQGQVQVDEVQLAHFTVKEYLLSSQITSIPGITQRLTEVSSHRHVAEACVVYLLQYVRADSLKHYSADDFPLATYTARYWGQHMRKCEDDEAQNETLEARIIELLQPTAQTYFNLLRLYDPDKTLWQEVRANKDFSDYAQDQIPSPLYFVSKAGLVSIVKLMIASGIDVNARSGKQGSALQVAAMEGHVGVAGLLLESGANVEGNWSENMEAYATPLCAATIHGHIDVVRLLLEYHADINNKGNDASRIWYGSPLYHAWKCNHPHIISLLLEHGARYNGVDDPIQRSLTSYDPASGLHGLYLYGSDWIDDQRSLPLRSPTPSPESQQHRHSNPRTTSVTGSNLGIFFRGPSNLQGGTLLAPGPRRHDKTY